MKLLIFLLTIFSLSHAVTFECEFPPTYSHFLEITLPYMCDVTSISFIKEFEDKELTHVTGDHEDGKSNLNVESLEINSYENLDFIPRKMGNIFRNLMRLDMSWNKIEVLNKDDIRGLRKLTSINLSSNRILRIEGGFFDHNLMLEKIELSDNKIKSVDEKLFDKLLHLNFIDLSSNECINMIANNQTEIPPLKEQMKTNCSQVIVPHKEEPTLIKCYG